MTKRDLSDEPLTPRSFGYLMLYLFGGWALCWGLLYLGAPRGHQTVMKQVVQRYVVER
jgi:hypothetical protein